MPRPGRRHPLVLAAVACLHWELLLPVLPVPILEQHRNRRRNGLSVPHARQDSGGIALDLHSAATAIALLASPQLAIHKFQVNLDPGRQSRKERDERFPMRLPRREESQHLFIFRIVSERRSLRGTAVGATRRGVAHPTSGAKVHVAQHLLTGERISVCTLCQALRSHTALQVWRRRPMVSHAP